MALFAEMMKGKPWTPATLKEVGGTEGVGVTFLEETFSASHRPSRASPSPESRPGGAESLLPESGTDIKGQMRSRQELLEASGYANRPRDFDDLIHILDPELRLITPTDPEGSSSEGQQTTPERAILPTRARLSGSLTAGLADPQAEGDPARTGGTAAGGTVGARGMPSPRTAICRLLGVGEHPAADQEEGLDRSATQNDEAGGAGAWRSGCPDLGSPDCLSSCRDRRSSSGHRDSTSDPCSRSGRNDSSMLTHHKSLTSSGRCENTASGSIFR